MDGTNSASSPQASTPNFTSPLTLAETERRLADGDKKFFQDRAGELEFLGRLPTEAAFGETLTRLRELAGES